MIAGLIRLNRNAGGARPKVSVIIAARNEARNISACLEALANQDYPPERWETIVIDDHSEDNTAEIVGRFKNEIPNLHLVASADNPGGLSPKKNAISTGIKIAQGDIILTTDADCTPPPQWISSMAAHFTDGVVAVVGVSPLNGSGLIGIINRFDSFINAVTAAATVGLGYPMTAVGRSFAYRRDAFHRVGGFGEGITGASGDDDLLVQSIAAAGGRVQALTLPDGYVPARSAENIADWIRMKRRHISAGRHYSPPLIAFATGMYLFNAGLAIGTPLALAGLTDWKIIGLWWGAKAVVDWAALMIGSLKLKIQFSLYIFLLAEMISPFVFTILIPTAFIGKVRWKGRKLSG